MRDMKKIKYTGKNVVAKPESLLPCFSFLPSLLSSSSIHPVFCSPSPQPPLPVFIGKPLPVLLFLSSARMESLTISMTCCHAHAADFPGVGKRGPPTYPNAARYTLMLSQKTKTPWLSKWGSTHMYYYIMIYDCFILNNFGKKVYFHLLVYKY